jgi:hypothetical protein
MKTNRRDFLKNSSLALGAGLAASALLQPLTAAEEAGQDQPHRSRSRDHLPGQLLGLQQWSQ